MSACPDCGIDGVHFPSTCLTIQRDRLRERILKLEGTLDLCEQWLRNHEYDKQAAELRTLRASTPTPEGK